MTIWITSGDRPSLGRVQLQQAGGFRKLKGSSLVKMNDSIINWGFTGLIPNNGWNISYLNRPLNVLLASNKLKAFKQFTNSGLVDYIVPYTEDQAEAQDWLDNDKTVVVRNTLTGHSGSGIVIIDPEEDETVPEAPLYTRYIFKTHEYRVHVVNEVVIDVQRKIRDPNREPTTWKVRSHANGFIYVRGDVTVSESVNRLAIDAVRALGLDFGAVDIIVDKSDKAYVLEVNTAPGLEGQTVELYANALRAMCQTT